MNFEWSEAKRAKVLKERGIDFLRVANVLFDGRPIISVSSFRNGEERFLSLIPIEGKLFAVIWMWREDCVRIITARRARDGEEKRYYALYA